MYQEI
jgi:hypothetical protein